MCGICYMSFINMIASISFTETTVYVNNNSSPYVSVWNHRHW